MKFLINFFFSFLYTFYILYFFFNIWCLLHILLLVLSKLNLNAFSKLKIFKLWLFIRIYFYWNSFLEFFYSWLIILVLCFPYRNNVKYQYTAIADNIGAPDRSPRYTKLFKAPKLWSKFNKFPTFTEKEHQETEHFQHVKNGL